MSTTKPFAIPYGLREGVLVHIAEAERGVKCNCVCPACNKPLVARKGPKRKHHFGHYPGTNCTPETVLHQLGKVLLRDRIAAAIASCEQLPIEWQCTTCWDLHKGNLIKLAQRVEMEATFGSCRPDLALLQTDGVPLAFLEVVVSHKPDENVLVYAAHERVTVVEFHIRCADDLDALGQSPILRPTKVHLCTRPKCSVCGGPLYVKMLYVVDGNCWKCHAQMKIALLMVDGQREGPECFSERQLALARKLGAILQPHYSSTAQERYVGNTCPNCGRLFGSFYLYGYSPQTETSKGHQTGHVCLQCATH